MIDQNTLEQLKSRLELRKKELEKELESFAQKSDDNWQTRYPNVPGEGLEEEADEVEEYENLLPIERALETKLKDIDLALEKIQKGTYGKCENCGQDIPIDRLEIFPEARICSECNKKTAS
jgi:DnaK suppressor protein